MPIVLLVFLTSHSRFYTDFLRYLLEQDPLDRNFNEIFLYNEWINHSSTFVLHYLVYQLILKQVCLPPLPSHVSPSRQGSCYPFKRGSLVGKSRLITAQESLGIENKLMDVAASLAKFEVTVNRKLDRCVSTTAGISVRMLISG
jgi:hypothetical protein